MAQTMELTMDTDTEVVRLVNDLGTILLNASLLARMARAGKLSDEGWDHLLTLIERVDFGHEKGGAMDYLDHIKYHLSDGYGLEFDEPEDDDEEASDEDDESEESEE